MASLSVLMPLIEKISMCPVHGCPNQGCTRHVCRNCKAVNSHLTKHCPHHKSRHSKNSSGSSQGIEVNSHLTKNCHKSRHSKKSSGSSHGIFVNFEYSKNGLKGACVLLGLEKHGRYANQLNMFGGKKDPNERSIDTLAREAGEEFGSKLKQTVSKKALQTTSCKSPKAKIFLVSLPKNFSRKKFKRNGEMHSAHWVKLSDLKNLSKSNTLITDLDGYTYSVSIFTINAIKKFKSLKYI